jgi:osmotically-inducible protein OsmY
MSFSKTLVSIALAVVVVGSSCSSENKDEARQAVQDLEDKTKEVVADAADKGKEIISSTGEAITDGWITTKVKAKFSDDKLLKDSGITVETTDRVVTLKGTAGAEAKKQAVTIAGGTEGVVRVVDQIVAKGK